MLYMRRKDPLLTNTQGARQFCAWSSGASPTALNRTCSKACLHSLKCQWLKAIAEFLKPPRNSSLNLNLAYCYKFLVSPGGVWHLSRFGFLLRKRSLKIHGISVIFIISRGPFNTCADASCLLPFISYPQRGRPYSFPQKGLFSFSHYISLLLLSPKTATSLYTQTHTLSPFFHLEEDESRWVSFSSQWHLVKFWIMVFRFLCFI